MLYINALVAEKSDGMCIGGNQVFGITHTINFKAMTTFNIVDASGDSSKTEVFEDGALKISFNSNNWPQEYQANAHVSAKDLETGDVVDLGTQIVQHNQGSFLVNLKDKLEAAALGGQRDRYDIQVSLTGGSQDNPIELESFSEQITLIKPKALGLNHLGNETANDFMYSDAGSALGSAYVYKGRGGCDSLHLEGIRSDEVSFFNGRNGIDAGSASELGQQSFYGGTVFDSLGLANGDELYLQGVEKLRFEDVTIDLSPNLDTSRHVQWNTQVMDVNGAWRFNTGSDDVVLVSLDTGFVGDANGNPDIHSDLKRAVNRTGVSTNDHGHRAMSVMAAAHDGSEVVGVAPDAKLWAYNVYEDGDNLYNAIEDAITNRQDGQKLVFQGGIQGENWWSNGATRNEMNELLGTTGDFGFFAVAAGNGGPDGNLTDPNYLNSVSGVAKASSDFDHIASIGALEGTGSWDRVDGLLNASATTLANY